MIKNQVEDLNKISPKAREKFNIIKNEKDKKLLNIDNIKISDKIIQKNFPELKLTNLKKKTGTKSPNSNNLRNIKNLTIVQMLEKNKSLNPIKNNSNSLMKKRQLPFPKISSVKNKNASDLKYFKKNFSICNNISSRWNMKIGMFNNDDYKTFFNKASPIKNEDIKNKDIITFFPKPIIKNEEDKIKLGNTNYKNDKQKLRNDIKSNFNNIQKKNNIQLQKLKITKNKSTNILKKVKNLSPNSTVFNPFHEDPNIFNPFQNRTIFKNKIIKNKPSTSPISNELKSLNADKQSSLNNLFNILRNCSPSLYDGVKPIQKEIQKIQLNSEILKKKYRKMNKEIISKKEDIRDKDFIKGYGYNSYMGNVRDINEDEVIVTKIYLNDDPNNYCFYFAIFDGHGGNGCSNYLKKNLHNNIKEFSEIGLKIAIDLTEERFKINEAVDEKGEIKDSSGSCGIILMIKGKKCIIANIGDSRLVIFKNELIDFTTMDHKPDSIIEKARIELAGGKVYKAANLFPLNQNEDNIEIPWRILPGRLTVSRTFGDIQAKDEKFGGNKTVIIALPDITKIILDDNYNFIVMGSNGIFDVLKNEEILQCIKIILKEKGINEDINDDDVHQLCGDFTDMIIKSSLAKNSFDNLSCIVIGLNLNDLLPIE